MPGLESRTLSIWVDRAPGEVYAFVSQPENLPKWASGLGTSITKSGDHWSVETPEGSVHLRYTEQNPYGVLDHTVHLPSGEEIYVPMRVISNGQGSEIMLTLFRQPSMTEDKFAEDARWVERDLAALKAVMES